jgi:hypothetical protein
MRIDTRPHNGRAVVAHVRVLLMHTCDMTTCVVCYVFLLLIVSSHADDETTATNKEYTRVNFPLLHSDACSVWMRESLLCDPDRLLNEDGARACTHIYYSSL